MSNPVVSLAFKTKKHCILSRFSYGLNIELNNISSFALHLLTGILVWDLCVLYYLDSLADQIHSYHFAGVDLSFDLDVPIVKQF